MERRAAARPARAVRTASGGATGRGRRDQHRAAPTRLGRREWNVSGGTVGSGGATGSGGRAGGKGGATGSGGSAGRQGRRTGCERSSPSTRVGSFTTATRAGASATTFADSGWRTINVPHDWSVEGPSPPANPFSQAAATTGRGGYVPSGIAWYRRHFTLPQSLSGQKVAIEFDGVMANSDVYVNGVLLGHHPYGYVSFRYDMTANVQFGGADNVVAVKTDTTVQPAERFFAGAGIYRHVRLIAHRRRARRAVRHVRDDAQPHHRVGDGARPDDRPERRQLLPERDGSRDRERSVGRGAGAGHGRRRRRSRRVPRSASPSTCRCKTPSYGT